MKIPISKPSITSTEMLYLNEAMSAWSMGKHVGYVEKFESEFSKYAECKYAVATSSCTGAIHVGLAALGIGRGDEVIIADINWIASVAPVVYLGAKPVFVDILPDTWCIDPDKVERAITKRTKAIIAVHLYGNLCDMDRLLAISKKHGIPLIEDAAEAMGSYWRAEHAGTMGDFGVFSFHGSKTISTGEGGMFITNNKSLYNRFKILSNHGRDHRVKKQFWPVEIGYKYKMTNIQGALGCAQLSRIHSLTTRKRDIFFKYKKLLGDLPVACNPEYDGTTNGYWMPTFIFKKFDRDSLLSDFEKNGIDGRVFFWPLSSLPMFDKVKENRVSYNICKRGVNLPSYYDIIDVEINKVVSVLKNNLGGK